jgi:hypothetical protein
VYVLLVYKAILLLHVLMQVVPATMSVPLMKSVILLLVVALLVKNVKPFAIQEIVLEGLIALPEITGKLVHADSL